MRALFDTNVVLDVLLARQPHAANAAELFRRVHDGALVGVLGATTLTTIHYIARRSLGTDGATRALHALIELFDVAPVTRAVLVDALERGFADFEDAVLDAAATAADVDAIVTRDHAGFARSEVPVFAPDALLAALDEPAS